MSKLRFYYCTNKPLGTQKGHQNLIKVTKQKKTLVKFGKHSNVGRSKKCSISRDLY